MRIPLKAAFAATTLLFAQPALAAIVDNGDGSFTISDSTTVGDTLTINFSGQSDGSVIDGLTSTLVLTFSGTSGDDFLFAYDLTNTSGSPLTSSIVTVFGFDTDPNVVLADSDATGDFDVLATGSISNSFSVEVCAKGGQDNNCAGGDPNAGAAFGETISGDLILDFNADLASITLSDFIVRYQGINGPGIEDGSGVGLPTNEVPEPATWAMMLLGFGAAGFALRRRRAPVLAQVA